MSHPGRQPHNIPHSHNGLRVGGAWNNYEGVGKITTTDGVTERDVLGVLLNQSGYTVKLTGKEDWTSGGHSLMTMLDSWTIYTRFPYSLPEQGGWHIWGDCGGNLTVKPGNETWYGQDWAVAGENTKWIAEEGRQNQPFFVYQGLNIVHPPYQTNEKYLARIDTNRIQVRAAEVLLVLSWRPRWWEGAARLTCVLQVPVWKPLDQLHPCDLETSMKKGCALPSAFYNTSEHKRNIIAGCTVSSCPDSAGAT